MEKSILKQELLKKLLGSNKTLPVYSIRKLSSNEVEERAKYYASRFLGGNSNISFSSVQNDRDRKLINLGWDTRMRLYHNSNVIVIKRKMNPLEHLIREKFDTRRFSEIVINVVKKLELDKWRLPFERVEFETLWQIKASGITIEKTQVPAVLCRVIGGFRRLINKVPVYGGASIFIKIAGDDIVESIGIDWREIKEKPVDEVKIIEPEAAAEKIIKNLSSTLPKNVEITKYYKPEFFALGYLSLPKRQKQNYMQPVYIAIFQSIGRTTLDRSIAVPATTHIYESID